MHAHRTDANTGQAGVWQTGGKLPATEAARLAALEGQEMPDLSGLLGRALMITRLLTSVTQVQFACKL